MTRGSRLLRAGVALPPLVSLVLLALLAAGCGPRPQFRNYSLPAMYAPQAPDGASPGEPVRLRAEDSFLLDGGIRVVRADVAKPIADFAFTDRYGREVAPATLHGRVVWIDLWATWCATCVAEFPLLQRLHERYEAAGLTILAVCRDSEEAAFARAADKAWLSVPLLLATEDRHFPVPYGAFPTSAVLDRQGRVRAYWQGHRSEAAVEGVLRALLSETNGEPVPPGAPATFAAAPRSSADVVSATLTLPRGGLAPGQSFEGGVVLDLAPGWFVIGGGGPDEVVLQLRTAPPPGLAALEIARVPPRRADLAGIARQVYTDRVEVPLWGVVADSTGTDRLVPIEVEAVFQACDSTSCLQPANIRLTGELWIAEPAESDAAER